MIAGEIAAGKTAVADGLRECCNARLCRAREAIQNIVGGTEWGRGRLQFEGRKLDIETQGRWLGDYLLDQLASGDRVVLDSVRTEAQTDYVRKRFSASSLIYLDAPPDVRRERYALARDSDFVKSEVSFEFAHDHRTEFEVRNLLGAADYVLDTGQLSVGQAISSVSRHVGWHMDLSIEGWA